MCGQNIATYTSSNNLPRLLYHTYCISLGPRKAAPLQIDGDNPEPGTGTTAQSAPGLKNCQGVFTRLGYAEFKTHFVF